MPHHVLCEACGQAEALSCPTLIRPCECGKKDEDRGWYHKACLAAALAEAAAEDTEHRASAVRCPRCRVQLRISVGETFVCDCAHVLRDRAAAHLGEACALLMALAMTTMALYFVILDASRAAEVREHPQSAAAKRYRLRHRRSLGQAPSAETIYWMEAGYGIILVMVVLVVWRVLSRFRRASSDLTVSG